MTRINRRNAIGLSVVALAPMAWAQSDWPTRPILLVLGFAPGGPNDLVGRAMALRLSEQLGQQVVVENKPGANGNIAAGIVARAAPDGYTYLYNSSSLALSAALYRKVAVDPLTELVPVNGTAALPLVCIAEASSPAHNFAEWAALLKANPGKYNYGSPGTGNLAHVAPAMILKANGLDAVHVPYKGSSEAIQGLLSGATQFQFDSVNSPLTLIKAGKVKPLFVTSAQRSPVLPDVPTLSESGGGRIDAAAWQGVMAPPKTPPMVIERFAAAVKKAMENPEMTSSLAAQGAYPIASTPRQYGEFFKDQIDRYKKVASDLGIQLD